MEIRGCSSLHKREQKLEDNIFAVRWEEKKIRVGAHLDMGGATHPPPGRL
jgi:hypothetical protein